jgi:dihydrofolate synthase/folylpolyglutamate synthase
MYNSLLEEIFHAYPMYHKVGTSAYKEGLENIEALLQIVGNPEKKLKAIHIAGTNGKGSVAHLSASYCQERGLKTGLFTSPHLVDFRERIRINGEMIPEEMVLEFFQKFKPSFNKLEPSFFEMTTALAFWYFAEQHVDVAVVEVGLGGRLDATNVLSPILSVITNITLEHTNLLGDTIAKIAFEKAGIIKKDTPVVVGEFHPESYPVFTDIANQKNAPLFLAENNFTIEGPLSDCRILDVEGQLLYEHVNMPLEGEYQRKNLVTFLQTAELLQQIMPHDKDVTVRAIERVAANTGFCGRWQVLRREPLTICDVGHNLGGLSLTMKQLADMPCRQLRMVFGMAADKDLDHILPLLPSKAKYYVCQAPTNRAIVAEELTTRLTALGLSCTTIPDVYEAFKKANSDAAPDDLIFIGGSCFVVGELLTHIHNS